MKKIVYGLLTLLLFFIVTFNVYADGQYLLKVNTEGMGQIKIASIDEEVEFDDEYPIQSAFENTDAGTKFKIGAKAYDDWTFVKWTLDGKDYSTEEEITVEVNSDMDLIAVFDIEGSDDDVLVTSEDDTTESEDTNNNLVYIGIGALCIVVVGAIVSIVILKKKKTN